MRLLVGGNVLAVEAAVRPRRLAAGAATQLPTRDPIPPVLGEVTSREASRQLEVLVLEQQLLARFARQAHDSPTFSEQVGGSCHVEAATRPNRRNVGRTWAAGLHDLDARARGHGRGRHGRCPGEGRAFVRRLSVAARDGSGGHQGHARSPAPPPCPSRCCWGPTRRRGTSPAHRPQHHVVPGPPSGPCEWLLSQHGELGSVMGELPPTGEPWTAAAAAPGGCGGLGWNRLVRPVPGPARQRHTGSSRPAGRRISPASLHPLARRTTPPALPPAQLSTSAPSPPSRPPRR